MATKKAGTKTKPGVEAKPAKAAKAKPEKPAVNVPKEFVPPDWGNVFAPAATVVSTGDPEVDDALAKVLAGDDNSAVRAIAERASPASLIANYRGDALRYVTVYWNDDVVATLSLGDKRKQKKVYWAAESAKNARDRSFSWFSEQLAKTPEGRAHLLELAASDGAARMRAYAAGEFRKAKPDVAMLRAIAEAIDPVRWVGEITNDTSTYLAHAYAVGTMCRVAVDPGAAFAHLAALLVPARDHLEAMRVAAVCWGIQAAVVEFGVDANACTAFVPALCMLLGSEQTKHYAMHALRVLPATPEVAEAAQRALGPSLFEVVYWDQNIFELIGTSSDPKWIPWHATALKANWMCWPGVFKGLHKIGDPVGTAVIEAWLVGTTAPDRVVAAKPLLADLYERHGPLTDAHRAAAQELLSPEFTAWGTRVTKKPKKKK